MKLFIYFNYILFPALWMIGGQSNEFVRRYLFPVVTSLTSWSARNRSKRPKIASGSLIFAEVLSLVYSDSLYLYRASNGIFNIYGTVDTIVRFVCASLIYLCVGCITSFEPIGFFALIAAFQLRLGGLKLNDKYDFLFEDLFRGLALAFSLHMGIL